jgi:formamidopyrimidine-DNA glycosylase
MPELPEVQTVVSDLEPILPGMSFTALDGSHANSIAGALDNENKLNGVKVSAVERRGKFINILFENNYVMTIHLRMSGRLLFRSLDDEPLKFERTRIDFDKGSLRFCDMRKFGKVWIASKDEYEEVTGISRLGVEPLSKAFSAAKFEELLTERKGVLKKYLLDQSLIAGIGNIYADEACFYAGVRPEALVENLDKEKLAALHKAIVKALKQGVANRGTSVSDYEDAYGRRGTNQELLYVYGRGGKDCLKCQTSLKKIRLVGRGTVYCPRCQKS